MGVDTLSRRAAATSRVAFPCYVRARARDQAIVVLRSTMIIAIVPIIAALVGLIVYALSANPKAAEIGRLLFACGALVSLLTVASHTVRLM